VSDSIVKWLVMLAARLVISSEVNLESGLPGGNGMEMTSEATRVAARMHQMDAAARFCLKLVIIRSFCLKVMFYAITLTAQAKRTM
tara:strand:+ start:3084 stop:3341 length:258 start_codon:yes stop_codon:yes gene_type:complete